MCNVIHSDIKMGFKQIALWWQLVQNCIQIKLNISFLSEANYVNQIRTTIKEVNESMKVMMSNYKSHFDVGLIKLKIHAGQSVKYAINGKNKILKREPNKKQKKRLTYCKNWNNPVIMEIKKKPQGIWKEKKLNWKKNWILNESAILRANCRRHNEGELKNTK